jgi:hypothetical protein
MNNKGRFFKTSKRSLKNVFRIFFKFLKTFMKNMFDFFVKNLSRICLEVFKRYKTGKIFLNKLIDRRFLKCKLTFLKF